jgi:uncharacterized protein (TIGR03435 family)
MKNATARAVVALVICGGKCSWAQDQSIEFEAASIKVAPPRAMGAPLGRTGCYGGPGSSDPIQYTCSNVTVSGMVLQAFDLKPYQLPKSYANTTPFDVQARVPPGTTREQVKMMLRNLLVTRFKLAFHYEKKEVQGYDLVVARGEGKLKEATPPPAAAKTESGAAASPKPIKDQDGFVYLPLQNSIQTAFSNGLIQWVGSGVTMEQLALRLNQIGQPVLDSTNLKGKYDFTLTFTADSFGLASLPPSPQPPDNGIPQSENTDLGIFQALEKQLGLKAQPRRIMIDVFVIDHNEEKPVER